MNALEDIQYTRHNTITCNFITNYKSYKKYSMLKESEKVFLFEPMHINKVEKDFQAYHLQEAQGHYFILQKAMQ